MSQHFLFPSFLGLQLNIPNLSLVIRHHELCQNRPPGTIPMATLAHHYVLLPCDFASGERLGPLLAGWRPPSALSTVSTQLRTGLPNPSAAEVASVSSTSLLSVSLFAQIGSERERHS